MQVKYSDVELVAFVPKHFTDKDGLEVSYNEAYFRHEDNDGIPSVMKFNTKLPLASSERHTGTITVEFDETGRNKPKLVGFVS